MDESDEKLYTLVADAMFEFIEQHLVSFPNATVSQLDFYKNKVYKRAMLFVFMVRYVFQLDGQKQWKNFSRK